MTRLTYAYNHKYSEYVIRTRYKKATYAVYNYFCLARVLVYAVYV